MRRVSAVYCAHVTRPNKTLTLTRTRRPYCPELRGVLRARDETEHAAPGRVRVRVGVRVRVRVRVRLRVRVRARVRGSREAGPPRRVSAGRRRGRQTRPVRVRVRVKG